MKLSELSADTDQEVHPSNSDASENRGTERNEQSDAGFTSDVIVAG
jgi:hypothetical protein